MYESKKYAGRARVSQIDVVIVFIVMYFFDYRNILVRTGVSCIVFLVLFNFWIDIIRARRRRVSIMHVGGSVLRITGLIWRHGVRLIIQSNSKWMFDFMRNT